MCRTSCLRECLWCMLRVLCCSAVAALSLRPVTCRCCLYLQWTVLGPWPEWGKFLSRRGKRDLMLVPLELKSCTTQWSVHVGCGGCVLVFWGGAPCTGSYAQKRCQQSAGGQDSVLAGQASTVWALCYLLKWLMVGAGGQKWDLARPVVSGERSSCLCSRGSPPQEE